MPNPFEATRYHSLVGKIDSIPNCLEITAKSTDDGEIMGVRHNDYPLSGIQFHPESILTNKGMQIIQNFLDS
jgi:anthranilate/para-aminobenzoate synthase component II